MKNAYQQLMTVMQQTRVIRFPRHALATFGASEIRYHLVSPVQKEPPASMLRTGLVIASRPKILTPDALTHRFEGFGENAAEFEGWLKESHREAFRALEYNFQNRPEGALSHAQDARALTEKVQKDLDTLAGDRSALIYAPEAVWQFALMKFTLEETLRSFRANVQELEERGLFDPAQAAIHRQKREIESLFAAAQKDAGLVKHLGAKLKEFGLFDEYQDRFFQLVKTH